MEFHDSLLILQQLVEYLSGSSGLKDREYSDSAETHFILNLPEKLFV